MLDDFAFLWAKVSVLSMFKVGQAKLWCSFGRLGILNTSSTYASSNS